MPRTRASATTKASIQPSQGSKITFGDDESADEDPNGAGPSTRTTSLPVHRDEDEEEEEEDSDDDAPEAVGLGRNEEDVTAAAELLAQ